jgi:hypothetical protein
MKASNAPIYNGSCDNVDAMPVTGDAIDVDLAQLPSFTVTDADTMPVGDVIDLTQSPSSTRSEYAMPFGDVIDLTQSPASSTDSPTVHLDVVKGWEEEVHIYSYDGARTQPILADAMPSVFVRPDMMPTSQVASRYIDSTLRAEPAVESHPIQKKKKKAKVERNAQHVTNIRKFAIKWKKRINEEISDDRYINADDKSMPDILNRAASNIENADIRLDVKDLTYGALQYFCTPGLNRAFASYVIYQLLHHKHDCVFVTERVDESQVLKKTEYFIVPTWGTADISTKKKALQALCPADNAFEAAQVAMRNEVIAGYLSEVAKDCSDRYFETLRNHGNHFHDIAHRYHETLETAVGSVKAFEYNVDFLTCDGMKKNLPGVGEKTAKRIEHLIQSEGEFKKSTVDVMEEQNRFVVKVFRILE